MDAQNQHTLQAHQIRFLRVVWCDNAGLIRAKAIHTRALPNFTSGIGITPAQMGLPVIADSVVADSRLGPVGEIRLMPDWSTLVPLPYAPGHARVLGDMVLDGQPWSLCPRGFLRRMIEDARREDLEIQAAFENEFYLLRPTPSGFEPVDDTVFAATWSMDLHHEVIDAMADALLAQNIEVESYYPESGPGQQELSIRHADALAAADRQIIFRETIRAVAASHDLRASFLPRLFADKAGSGAHLHLSLWRDGQNLVPDRGGMGGLSDVAGHFVAGILHHLPALMALTTPSTNSYRRLQPGCWAGAYRIWGSDNREAAIRVLSSPEGARHWELKTVDATCNPHLALGAVLACGLDGIRRQLPLPASVDVDPGWLTDADRLQRGIERLPSNLGESLIHLQSDEVLAQAMQMPLYRAFVAVRSSEWQTLERATLANEVNLLWERY